MHLSLKAVALYQNRVDMPKYTAIPFRNCGAFFTENSKYGQKNRIIFEMQALLDKKLNAFG